MAYTTEQILEKVNNPEMLYQREVINYKGKTSKKNGEKLYTEIIAEKILNDIYNKKNMEDILLLTNRQVREQFEFYNHDGETSNKESNRREERFCLSRYNKDSPWGKIINYQVNIIPGTKINVDLIAYEETLNILTLIEVKGYENEDTTKKTSNETLLRCVLEIESYYRLLNRKKEVFFSTLSASDKKVVTSSSTKLNKAIWLPKNSKAYSEFTDLKNRPKLEQLIKDLEIKIECFNK